MNTEKDDIISRIRARLAEHIGSQKYKIWFHNSTHMALANGFLKVGVPNVFVGSWIESHFAEAIARSAREMLGRELQIMFSIEPDLFRNIRKTQLNSQAKSVNRGGETAPAVAGVDVGTAARPRLRGRLDDFVVGPGSELACSIIRTVSQHPGVAFNPVFLHGGCGIGKTHLLQGLANAIDDAGRGQRWRYISGEAFTNEFLLALKNGQLESFRRRYRELDVLLIDDVHFLANKRATQDEFLHTFNAIFAIGKQVVLASDAHPKMIGQLSEALVSRFVSGVVVKIDPPDVATRCEILRRRAMAIGRPIPDDVIAYVAEKIQNNVRELEGALLKLVAAADVAKSPISMAIAKHVLDDHLTRTAKILTVNDIELAVSTYFGLTPSDLHSSRKSRTIALARNIAMYLARVHTPFSFPEIARMMGNKNHTTVLLAHRKIKGMLETDAAAIWFSASGEQSSPARGLVAKIEEQIRPDARIAPAVRRPALRQTPPPAAPGGDVRAAI